MFSMIKLFVFLIVSITFVVFLVFANGCKSNNEEINKETEIQAIMQIHKQAAVAVKNGDVAAYVDLYTEDGIYLWPNAPAIVGREELKAWFEKRFSEYSAEIEKSIDEIEILGDWAFERGREISRIRNRATNEMQIVKGKFINIFKKQSDGYWKIARRIRNFDHPISSDNRTK